MIAAGLQGEEDHALKASAISLAIMSSPVLHPDLFVTQTGRRLQMRIGIHSGPVMAGVTGTTKFAYHLFGDTVNTASRMETNSLFSTIQVSPSTYELLKDQCGFQERGPIPIKGKGDMLVYILLKMRKRSIRSFPDSLQKLLRSPSQTLELETQQTSTSFHPEPEARRDETGGVGSGSSNTAASHVTVEHLVRYLEKKKQAIENNVLYLNPTPWQKAILKNQPMMKNESEELGNKAFKKLFWWCLLFRSPRVELAYQRTYMYKYRWRIVIASIILIQFTLAFLVSVLVGQLARFHGNVPPRFYAYIFGALVPPMILDLVTIVLCTFHTRFYLYGNFLIIAQLFLTGIGFSIIQVKLTVTYTSLFGLGSFPIVPKLIAFSFYFFFYGITWILAVVAAAVDLAFWLALGFSQDTPKRQYFFVLSIAIPYFIGLAATSYLNEKVKRREFELEKRVVAQLDETDRLLLKLLPPTVAREMKDKEVKLVDMMLNESASKSQEDISKFRKVRRKLITAITCGRCGSKSDELGTTGGEQRSLPSRFIADAHPIATVVSSDLVGFTQVSSTMTPADLFRFLNALYSSFDRIAEQHGIYKIDIIGDAYICVSGLPEFREDHADAAIAMGLEMQQALDRVVAEHNVQLQMRIGVNTGPVMAGVIGSKRFRFQIWGPTVKTATFLESTCAPGRVHVSEATREALDSNGRNRWEFEERQVRDRSTGDEPLVSWLVRGKEADDISAMKRDVKDVGISGVGTDSKRKTKSEKKRRGKQRLESPMTPAVNL